MSTMSVNEYGDVTFHPPDSSKDDKDQLEYWEWALFNVNELINKVELGYLPSRVLNEINHARKHCQERIKFYTKRPTPNPTPMRSG